MKNEKLTQTEQLVEKYRLQNLASRIAYIEGKKEGLTYPSDWHRISKCRVVTYNTNANEGPSVMRSKAHGSCHFTGLVTCASAWVCPVCAPLIQARRAERVIQTFKWAYDPALRTEAIALSEQEYQRRAYEDLLFDEGKITKKKVRQHMPTPELLRSDLKVVMLTLTTPHSRDDTTVSLFEDFVLANQQLRSGRKWNDFKRDIGLVGEIIGTEVTFGNNGPHVHRHILMVVKNTKNNDETEYRFRNFFLKNWGDALHKIGLLDKDNEKQYRAFCKYGVDVIPFATESDYLTKQGKEHAWGADGEIAKQSKKKGTSSSRTPFEVLSDSAENKRDVFVFIDYIKGTKGRSQLTWSRGFKKLIGLEELDEQKQDEIDASESDDACDLLSNLTYSDWRLVVSHKQRGNLLKAAQEEGLDGIISLISDLKKLGKTAKDPQNIPVLFDKYFNELVEMWKAKPFTFANPNLAKNSKAQRDFVLDFYANILVELHAKR